MDDSQNNYGEKKSDKKEKYVLYFIFKDCIYALAGVAQWIECWPVNQWVAGSVPSRGTCLGCRQGPQ